MLEMGLNLAVLRPYRLQMQLVWAFLVVAPAPFCVCFAVSPAGETQIWPGDLRVLAAVFGFCFIFDLPRDCGTKVFHNVLICLPASRAKSAATEGKKADSSSNGVKTSFSRSTPVQIQCNPIDTIVNGNSHTIGSDNEYDTPDKRIHRTLPNIYNYWQRCQNSREYTQVCS